MALLTYKNGKFEIVKSFAKAAKDSDGKPKAKAPITEIKSKKSNEEVDLFNV